MMLSEIKFKLKSTFQKESATRFESFLEKLDSIIMEKFPIAINNESNDLHFSYTFDEKSKIFKLKSRIYGDKNTQNDDDFLYIDIDMNKEEETQTLNHKMSIAEFPLVMFLFYLKYEMKDDIDVFFNNTVTVKDMFLFLLLNKETLNIDFQDIYIDIDSKLIID